MHEEAIHGEVELTENDYVQAHLAWAERSGHIRGYRRTAGFLLFVVGVGVMIGWPPAPGVWALMTAALLAWLYFARWQWVWIGRRAFADLPKPRRRFEVWVSSEEMLARGPRAEVRYAWSVVNGWFETDTLFVLVAAHGVVDLCPKSAFAEADLPRLRETFDEAITPPAPPVAEAKRGDYLGKLLVWAAIIAAMLALQHFLGPS